MQQFFTCEICFQNMDGARAAMDELAEHGIKTKIFDVVDPYSSAVFVGAWREGAASFKKIAGEIAERNNGGGDCFGVADHEPVPEDFGFTVENEQA
jgi:hypothetical protein